MGTCYSTGISALTCPLQQSLYSPNFIVGRLPSLGADLDSITISGLSGGSYGASYLSTAFSDTFMGVGLWIGGNFGEDVLESASEVDPVTTAAENVALANELFAEGEIDDPANISGMPVYIFSGTEDKIVVPSRQKGQKEFYDTLGANIDYHEEPVGHLGFMCDDDLPHCGKNLVKRMMTHFFTTINDSTDVDWEEKGILRHFWQPYYVDTFLWKQQFSPLGYVFYPKQCYDGTTQCKLHIHLHGCLNSVRVLTSVWNSPQNYFYEFAVANDMIVVFPDIQPSFRN